LDRGCAHGSRSLIGVSWVGGEASFGETFISFSFPSASFCFRFPASNGLLGRKGSEQDSINALISFVIVIADDRERAIQKKP
jgi:hypothetical protein